MVAGVVAEMAAVAAVEAVVVAEMAAVAAVEAVVVPAVAPSPAPAAPCAGASTSCWPITCNKNNISTTIL